MRVTFDSDTGDVENHNPQLMGCINSRVFATCHGLCKRIEREALGFAGVTRTPSYHLELPYGLGHRLVGFLVS